MRSQVQTKRARSMASQYGFSLIELLIVIAIILIIAAIAIPNLLRSRMAANEASAVANIRTITSASVSYWVVYSNGYPANLGILGGPGPVASCNAAVLVDSTITSAPNQKSGYQYALTGDQGNVPISPPGCTPGFVGYFVTAVPITLGTTGNISYCSTEPGVIHYDPAGATAGSPAICTTLPTLQ